MASYLAKLGGSYVFSLGLAATASLRFFDIKRFHQDHSEDRCNVKHYGPQRPKVRDIFNKAICPPLSVARNLTRVLNMMANGIGDFPYYPPGPKWDVTEDDKAIYLVHHIRLASTFTTKYVEETVDHSPYVIKNVFAYLRVYRTPGAILFIVGSSGPDPGSTYPGYFFKMYLPANIYSTVWDIKMEHVKNEVLKITIPKQKGKSARRITTKFSFISANW